MEITAAERNTGSPSVRQTAFWREGWLFREGWATRLGGQERTL